MNEQGATWTGNKLNKNYKININWIGFILSSFFSVVILVLELVKNKENKIIQDKCENNNCYDLFDCFQEGV